MSTGEKEGLMTTTFDYDDYYEDEGCDRADVIQFGATLTPVLFSLITVLSLFGNILVLVILAKYENLKSLTNAFIVNLAVSDLIFTLGLPFWAYYHHLNRWTLGETTCKAVSFVFYTGYYSSGIFLIMMTVHRYLAVMHPLSDIVSTKGRYGILISVVIWTASIFAATPALIFSTVLSDPQNLEQEYCTEYRDADVKWQLWGIYQQNILFVVTLLVFGFCYVQILVRLLRPTSRRRQRTVKLICILVIVFFVGWAPYNAVLFVKSHFKPNVTDSRKSSELCEARNNLDFAFYVCRLVAFSHCCLNPVFYVFVGVKFKNHLKRMLQSLFQHGNNIHYRNSVMSQSSCEESFH